MGRTNIVLDDALVAEALRLSALRTKREVVEAALEHFVAWQRRRAISELRGRIRFAPAYDHRKLRRGR